MAIGADSSANAFAALVGPGTDFSRGIAAVPAPLANVKVKMMVPLPDSLPPVLVPCRQGQGKRVSGALCPCSDCVAAHSDFAV